MDRRYELVHFLEMKYNPVLMDIPIFITKEKNKNILK